MKRGAKLAAKAAFVLAVATGAGAASAAGVGDLSSAIDFSGVTSTLTTYFTAAVGVGLLIKGGTVIAKKLGWS
ncbi:MAG: hypothetical protein PHT19_01520 [Methylococcus sp.]|nr:hypothetical protein [Methylococcus sp.]